MPRRVRQEYRRKNLGNKLYLAYCISFNTLKTLARIHEHINKPVGTSSIHKQQQQLVAYSIDSETATIWQPYMHSDFLERANISRPDLFWLRVI